MKFDHRVREIKIKIVYYGPGLSGKTTNLEVIHQRSEEKHRGNLTSIATAQDRTLFFDYMPLDLGSIDQFKIRINLFTVPGQVFYNATRKMVLRDADGIVFVADSQKNKREENIESLQNLVENLTEYGVNLTDIPLVLQYNKRDLADIMTVDEMEEDLNSELNAISIPATAVRGKGVFSCLRKISHMVLDRIEEKRRDMQSGEETYEFRRT